MVGELRTKNKKLQVLRDFEKSWEISSNRLEKDDIPASGVTKW